MTLRYLRIFEAVCRHMSITRAAQELYLSQPSVSLAIGELEKKYEVRLFDRIGKSSTSPRPGRSSWAMPARS